MRQAYRIVKMKPSKVNASNAQRYDQEYEYALVDRDNQAIACSGGPGPMLKKFQQIANDAYNAGFQDGLQFNGEVET
jgi:hypothetical protein